MKVKTKLGEIEVPKDKVITFREGLPGLENLKKFVIVSNGSDPIMWLVSIEDDSIALPIINPWLVRIDYVVDIPRDVMEDLEIKDMQDVQVWAVLVIPKDKAEDMTINLLAPIVVNVKKGLGKQVIMEGSGYDIRHFVKEELERSKKLAEKEAVGAG